MNYEVVSCENGFIILNGGRDRSRSCYSEVWVAKSPSDLAELIKLFAISHLNQKEEDAHETP